jgi:hypothetical protein
MNWYVGQPVYCLAYGHGNVVKIDIDLEYPIIVSYSNWGSEEYTLDGKIWEDGPVCLYSEKPEITVPKWQPKPGEWCWFWMEEFEGAYLRRFAKMENGRYMTNINDSYYNCAPFVGELPEHLKEVQP